MPITDLTGYTWVGNDNLTEGINASFYISFISNSTNFTSIDLYLGHYFDGVYYGPVIVYTSDFDDNRSWTNDAYKTIQITGGTDATNSTLIAWLEANGTLTAPIQANTYNLTHSLTNLTKGNITLQITPDTNYTYPTSLTITNGTIVSYDNTTGIAVINGDDTTIVSGECVEPAPIKCIVDGLGSQNPSSVSFTKDADFTLAGLGIETVVIGGNTFIKIPTMYRKVDTVVSNQITKFTIANAQIDNAYQPYPCFLDENGNLLEYILVGKYMISSTTTANSVNASAKTMKIGTGRTLCRAKTDANYQGLLYDWQIHKLWQDLIICFKQTINTNSGTAWNTDNLGIYWSTKSCWVDGLVSDSNTIRFSYKPSAYVDSPTSSTTDYNTTNYTMPSSEGNITKLGYDSSHPFVNMPSSASGTSYTTYYCDRCYGGYGNCPFPANVGFADASYGAFRSSFSFNWTDSYSCVCRLCLRPIQ